MEKMMKILQNVTEMVNERSLNRQIQLTKVHSQTHDVMMKMKGDETVSHVKKPDNIQVQAV